MRRLNPRLPWLLTLFCLAGPPPAEPAEPPAASRPARVTEAVVQSVRSALTSEGTNAATDQTRAAAPAPTAPPPAAVAPLSPAAAPPVRHGSATLTGPGAKELEDFLKAKCAACHGGPNNRVVPGFDVLDLEPLVEKGYVVPGSPGQSTIWLRVSKGEMPPPSLRPLSQRDKDGLEQAITMLRNKELMDIVSTGKNDPRLSFMVQCAAATYLTNELADEAGGPFTIFAPTNEAFDIYTEGDRSSLLKRTVPLWRLIVNHGSRGNFSAAELEAHKSITTLGNTELEIERRDGTLSVGGAMVIQADIQCTNGVIHVINRVLAPAGPPPPFKMVAIEGGVFIMGSNKPGESPPREVRISSFLIGKYEVTRGKYYEIMGVDPSYDKPQFQFSGQWENLPVQHVTWYDAVEFCNAMSKAEGYTPYYSVTVQAGGKKVVQVLDPEGNGYRLPTEAEWEYACRAGTSTDFCCGNSSSVLDGYAWHRQNLPVGPPGPQPFGSKLPNAWDLHDMHGNVQEWCQDWFTRPYPAWTGAGPEPDPRGPLSGSPVPAKVLRGGSYVTPPDLCRSTFRTSAASPGNGKDDYRHAAIGFRLARTPKGGTSP